MPERQGRAFGGRRGQTVNVSARSPEHQQAGQAKALHPQCSFFKTHQVESKALDSIDLIVNS